MPSFDLSPTDDPRDSLRLFAQSEIPGCEGASASFEAPVLAVHLGTPARVYQRRAGRRYDATFREGQLSLIAARCDTTCSTKDPFSFVHLQWGARFFAQLDIRELPNVYRFDDPICKGLLESMLTRAQREGGSSRLYLESAAVVLAERALELHVERGRATPRPGAPELVARAEDYFRAHMAESPGIADVAASVGLSVRHFTRLFKRTTGVSPYRYFDAIRVERARALLAGPALRVLDVALDVGFSNPSQFASFFRRATGYSPQDFKRRYRA